MNDLDQLLHGAHDEIAAATGPIDARDLMRVRGTVRRARLQRHTFESVGAAACAGVLGVGAWAALGQGGGDPMDPATSTPGPSPTSAPTGSPVPAPTPAGTKPPVRTFEREDEIDDADVVARLSAPRTGETWTEPVRDDAVEDVLVSSARREGTTIYRVGTRDDATIYVAVDEATSELRNPPYARTGAVLYEIDDDGARLISCPSARAGDACQDPSLLVEGTQVEVDTETFYDTTTLPSHMDLGGGWKVSTPTGSRDDQYSAAGVPIGFGTAPIARLADVGAVSFVVAPVVGDHTDIVDDLTSGAYAWLLPYGAYVLLDPKDVPGASFDDITWEDGKTRISEWRSATLAPGAMQCLDAQTSIEAEHDPTQWRRGGTTADGLPVMVPIAGGNEASKLTRWFHEQHSGTMIDDELVTGADAGYRYLTDDEFLAAHALIAIQAPDGAWHLRMRADAANIVYECA